MANAVGSAMQRRLNDSATGEAVGVSCTSSSTPEKALMVEVLCIFCSTNARTREESQLRVVMGALLLKISIDTQPTLLQL
jgi:hypothetical protein